MNEVQKKIHPAFLYTHLSEPAKNKNVKQIGDPSGKSRVAHPGLKFPPQGYYKPAAGRQTSGLRDHLLCFAGAMG